MASLEKRALGSSCVEVSRMALGMVPLSGFGVPTTYDEFEQTVIAAFQAGVTFLDVAPGYGNGRSEHFLGHVLRTNGLRPRVVLSSKCGRLLKARRLIDLSKVPPSPVDWIDGLPFEAVFDYSYDGLMRSFEDTLQRLGIDDLDVLQVHDIGRASHGPENDRYWKQLQDGGFRALRELRESGAVRAVGIGVNEIEAPLAMAEEFPLDCVLIAGRYTLIHDEASERFFPECVRRGIAVIAAGAFNSGILAGGAPIASRTFNYGAPPQEVIEKVANIEKVCDEYDVALPTAAIQFVAAHPAVTSVLVGAKSPEEISFNVAALGNPVPAAFWTALTERGLIPAGSVTPSNDKEGV